MVSYQGKGVFPGIAFGNVFLMKKRDAEDYNELASDSHAQWQKYLSAKETADIQLKELFGKTTAELGEEKAMIIDVQRMMLLDKDFDDAVELRINTENKTAAKAVMEAGEEFSAFFSSLDDVYMQARSTDVMDVSGRLADILLGQGQDLHFTKPVIVLADDLTPSETLQMNKEMVRAFVIRRGSSNSHTAILARTMNIPCLVNVLQIPLSSEMEGKQMIVDGDQGICYLDPGEEEISYMTKLQHQQQQQRSLLEEQRGLPTVTTDGRKIKLYANIGEPQDLDGVLANDAEGIGLFRSEFLYLGRKDYPGEEELFGAYKKVVQGMEDRQVIIRTLDIGADKKVGYFMLDEEENPAMGLRGIRVCIDRPELFKTQLRAIYRASVYGNVGIMFPMISSLWEIKRCKELAAEVRHELGAAGLEQVELGIMVETPAAVMLAEDFAREVDFFSVGTNDLTQYTLAIDRQNDSLERFYDPRHPAVLRMLAMVAEAANKNGIWAGICGELASDTELTRSFVDMGYRELSVSPAYILELRKKIRAI